MPTKTISLKLEAYERLRAARRSPNESFSQVILRARWPETTITGRMLAEQLEKHGGVYPDEALDEIERADRADVPPTDKWRAL